MLYFYKLKIYLTTKKNKYEKTFNHGISCHHDIRSKG